MRHPFDGIIVPTPASSRRSWVKGVFASIAGLFAASAAKAAAPTTSKVRLVSADAEPSPEPGVKPTPATKALGEQGGAVTKAVGEQGGRMTTQALREEGAIATTLAIGEEGAATRALNENGAMTTKALGEEGAGKPVPQPKPPIQVTSLALGEEG